MTTLVQPSFLPGDERVQLERHLEADQLWVVHEIRLGQPPLRYGPFRSESKAVRIRNKILTNPDRLWTREELGIGTRERRMA